MNPEQRRYLFLQSGVGAAIVNAALNGGIGWLITRGLAEFPVWRIPGVGFDLLATAFGVVFGTVLAMAVQVRLDVARGKISPFPPPAAVRPLLGRFSRGVLARSVILGVAAVPVFAVPVLAALFATGLPALSRSSFVTLKAILAGVEGGLVTPLIVLGALEDIARAAAPAAGKAPETSS